jgi:hypothetical protein
MRFLSGSLEVMRLATTADVGINNSNPSAFNSLGGRTLAVGNGTTTSTLTLFSDDTADGNGYGHVAFADSDTSSSTAQYAGLLQYFHGDNSMRFYTASTERLRIFSDGDVSIGMAANYAKLNVNGDVRAENSKFLAGREDAANPAFAFHDDSDTGIFNINPNILGFSAAGTERMRIDGATGNVGIGTSSPSQKLHVAGNIVLDAAGFVGFGGGTNYIEGSATSLLKFGTANVERMRIESDGKINIGGVGNISPYGIRFAINGTGSGGAGLYFGSGVILPTNNTPTLSDNTVDLGASNYRFNDAFVTNGVTAGSDGNLKQDIAELTDAEQRVAVACKGLLRKFRWIDAVEAKGDEARIHFGIIAQDLQAAFEAEGLDAGRYAMFMSNTWWETQTEVAAVEATEDSEAVDAYTRTDTYDAAEEAPEGATERTRLGVRYSELLAFIISAI